MRRYASSLFFGTGVTKPSTYAMGGSFLLQRAHRLADRPDRPHFRRADRRGRDARGDLDRLVQVARLDHVEAREALLGLGEGSVGDRYLAAAHAHRGRRGHRFQRLGRDAMAAAADFIVEGDAAAVVHRLQRLLLTVNQTQIFHGVLRNRFRMLFLSHAELLEALHFLARREILELVERTHFDLRLDAVDGGIRVAPGPFDRFLTRFRLDDGVAGDELLGFRERPVDEAALRSVVVDAPALAARLQARGVDQHAGLLQLLVVLAHLGEQALR